MKVIWDGNTFEVTKLNQPYEQTIMEQKLPFGTLRVWKGIFIEKDPDVQGKYWLYKYFETGIVLDDNFQYNHITGAEDVFDDGAQIYLGREEVCW